jgi:hypothetical protein
MRPRQPPYRGFKERDFDDARHDEDRADNLQERAIACAFDNANPRETGANHDPDEPFRARLNQANP